MTSAIIWRVQRMGCQLGRTLEQSRGVGVSVGSRFEWRGRQGTKGLPVGPTLAAARPPQLRCQGDASLHRLYLLPPLPPLLRLC